MREGGRERERDTERERYREREIVLRKMERFNPKWESPKDRKNVV